MSIKDHDLAVDDSIKFRNDVGDTLCAHAKTASSGRAAISPQQAQAMDSDADSVTQAGAYSKSRMVSMIRCL